MEDEIIFLFFSERLSDGGVFMVVSFVGEGFDIKYIKIKLFFDVFLFVFIIDKVIFKF